MEQGLKNVAARIVQAENDFIENVMAVAGCTKAEAEKVLAVYRKHKIVKMDAVNGFISVKHGMFWDVAIIRNAIAA